MDKNAVYLGARNQTIVAELASVMRSFVYRVRGGEGDYSGDDLFNELWEWVERYDVKPQELDYIYDVLHRSGANR